MTRRDFNSNGWKRNRDDWSQSVGEIRLRALTDIEARRAWVTGSLSTAWDRLAPILDEIEYREIPRDSGLWRRACSAIQQMRNEALASEEDGLVPTLNELLAAAALFGQQAVKDESPM